jgi:hypothetical protein
MPGRIIIPTDAEIAAAFANPPPKRGPRATSVSYRPARDEVRLVLNSAVTLLVPRAAIDELRDLPKSHLRGLRLTPGGGAVALDQDDVHISVPGLVRGLVGFEQVETAPAPSSARTSAARSTGRRKAPAA